MARSPDPEDTSAVITPVGDGMFSRNESAAHKAILQGDPLGGGPYLYPPSPSTSPAPPQAGPSSAGPGPRSFSSRSNRRGRGSHDPGRRNSWGAGPAIGMAWRAPQFGGNHGQRITIAEENDMAAEQQQHGQQHQHQHQHQHKNHPQQGQQQRSSSVMLPGDYVEDVPRFQGQTGPSYYQQPMQRRPGSRPVSSMSSAYSFASGSGDRHQQSRPPRYPVFAPPPQLPPMDQFLTGMSLGESSRGGTGSAGSGLLSGSISGAGAGYGFGLGSGAGASAATGAGVEGGNEEGVPGSSSSSSRA